MIKKWCNRCGKKYTPKGKHYKYCDKCRKGRGGWNRTITNKYITKKIKDC